MPFTQAVRLFSGRDWRPTANLRRWVACTTWPNIPLGDGGYLWVHRQNRSTNEQAP